MSTYRPPSDLCRGEKRHSPLKAFRKGAQQEKKKGGGVGWGVGWWQASRDRDREKLPACITRPSRSWCSKISFEEFEQSNVIEDDDFLPAKSELEPQGVDPKRGWNFRGVHKVCSRNYLCRIGQAPIQKILRNGKTVTIFTVGTGGMFDQRIIGSENLPKPAQWHRIAVHNEQLGAYAVQQLSKDPQIVFPFYFLSLFTCLFCYVMCVFLQLTCLCRGDIETRVYNDSINGQIKNIPEICVRRDGKVQRIKTGESISSISLDELKDGLF
ncbi:unnamed protein product [Spirodela intermedia]|uniref:Uncharacterized protein n=1 Tax=Spirodela intermedia TaxID=51605 RepID=A0A7I8JKH1_SPIIN|nr:unnamed protein product [Spirodela intermedia]CAA6670654.1 unnamed protein product [Spirodela intermedia]